MARASRAYKKRRVMSPADRAEVVRLHLDEALSLSEIAKKLGFSLTPVQRTATAAGILFGAKNRWSLQLRKRVVDAYTNGTTSTVLAARYRTSAQVILSIVREAGADVRFHPRVFTAGEEAEIERRYLAGDTAQEIGPSFGVFHKRVLRVLRDRGVKIRRSTPCAWTDRRGRKLHFRSKWELWVAQFLDNAGLSWDYEFQWYDVEVNGKDRRYTPDFWVWDGDSLRALIDVKGKRHADQMKKIALFQEQYPNLPFEMWTAADLRGMGCMVQVSRSVLTTSDGMVYG